LKRLCKDKEVLAAHELWAGDYVVQFAGHPSRLQVGTIEVYEQNERHSVVSSAAQVEGEVIGKLPLVQIRSCPKPNAE